MKRKRGTGKCNPKKSSGKEAAEDSVDPGYYSDNINEKNDNFSVAEIETREVLAKMSGQRLGLDSPVMNNETVGGAAAFLARAISSSHTTPASVNRPKIGQKEPKSSQLNSFYNKKELDAAKLVIKKIMKMDAAVPFNAPVDPIALGIPDYFDIIDTPMDFGTICSKLENGLTYRNSEEVFKDVQLIWDNCSKYNKKGSYILELMKRVKSNFMKQWNASGLYKEKQTVSNGHLHNHNPEPVAESTVRHGEGDQINPVGLTTSRSTHLQQNDWTLMNQSQHQPVPPCCSHTFKAQPIAYRGPFSLQSGHSQSGHHHQHHHDLAPQHSHYTHMHSGDHMNGQCCSQWVNEASPSFMGHAKQRGYMHQHHSSSAQLPPSRLQAAISTHTPGHFHSPLDSGRDGDDGYQHSQYQTDTVHMHTYHPSPSVVPLHQPNQSTRNHLQSSHIEGGRNTACGANQHIQRPTESTANCTKFGTECPRSPIVDNTICQELNGINSSPEQSSSSQPLENNQPESSPSEIMHSTADNNISKTQKNQPEGNNQTIYAHSKPSPSTADVNRKRKAITQGRGPSLLSEFKGPPIKVTNNDQGTPVGPGAQKLVTFLGTLARNPHCIPLTFSGWRTVPAEIKQNMWEQVLLRFKIDPTTKVWVLNNLGLRWKNWKSRLKTAHYDRHETDGERLADRDERVPPEQWVELVNFWSTESFQRRCARNKENRKKKRFAHTTGRKSFATLREELRSSLPDGKEPSRAELFIVTRTRKDGKPVNEASSQVITKLRERVNDQTGPQAKGDVLTEVIGADKKGNPRCVELGPSSSRKLTRYESNDEILEMREKMSVLEKTCAEMASQMAAMMSMMSNVQGSMVDKNGPDKVVVSSPASDPSVPQEVQTRSRVTRQTRQSKSKSRI